MNAKSLEISEAMEIMNGLKEPPHNTQLEFEIIGCILCNNSVFAKVSFLQGDDFYQAPHRHIFEAMRTLHTEGKPITPFTLPPLMASLEAFKEIPAHKYLVSATASASLVQDIAYHAALLRSVTQRRNLLFACISTIDALNNESDKLTPEQHAHNLAEAIDAIAQQKPSKEFYDNYEVTEMILNNLKDDRRPYSTGIKGLDEAMGGGLYPGKCYGFVARKKMGKTAIAATISNNINRNGVKHLMICCEMSKEEVQERVLAHETQCFNSAFRNSYGKDREFGNKIAEAINHAPRNALYADAPGITFSELKRLCRNAVEKRKITGLILDYWQLVGGKIKGQSTAEHLDDVAQWIADFCRRNGLWAIVLGQINQEGNTRGSEGIRLACDQLYELHREDVTQPGTWIEMLETRYTKWANIGSKTAPRLLLQEKGPYFTEINTTKTLGL